MKHKDAFSEKSNDTRIFRLGIEKEINDNVLFSYDRVLISEIITVHITTHLV